MSVNQPGQVLSGNLLAPSPGASLGPNAVAPYQPQQGSRWSENDVIAYSVGGVALTGAVGTGLYFAFRKPKPPGTTSTPLPAVASRSQTQASNSATDAAQHDPTAFTDCYVDEQVADTKCGFYASNAALNGLEMPLHSNDREQLVKNFEDFVTHIRDEYREAQEAGHYLSGDQLERWHNSRVAQLRTILRDKGELAENNPLLRSVTARDLLFGSSMDAKQQIHDFLSDCPDDVYRIMILEHAVTIPEPPSTQKQPLRNVPTQDGHWVCLAWQKSETGPGDWYEMNSIGKKKTLVATGSHDKLGAQTAIANHLKLQVDGQPIHSKCMHQTSFLVPM